ncbi:MAG: hypothetical protein M3291_08580 [Actinomycetota bacterium]|nr:hypothetical protein [Actinomycetota bacterium]
MSGPGYPATPLLARLSPANGWRHDLVGDGHGQPYALVAVRIGPVWTDSVAILGEDQTLAMRHRTRKTDLIVPAELPGESSAVWRRHGRCQDVLAELFELP